MTRCALEHCGGAPTHRHPKHSIHLCGSCLFLVERFGYPSSLGDLSGLLTLAVRKYGLNEVRAAIHSIEHIARSA